MLEPFPSLQAELADLEFEFDISAHPLFNEKAVPILTDEDQLRAQELFEGKVDISILPQGENWAWLGAPRWIDSRRAAIKNTTGRFTCLDVCSAVPLYAAMTEGRHFKRCRDKAHEVMGNLTDTVVHRKQTPLTRLCQQEGFNDVLNPLYIVNRIFDNDELSEAIESAVHFSLYCFDAEESLFERSRKDELQIRFAQRLFFELITATSKFARSQADLQSLEWRWSMDYKSVPLSASVAELLRAVSFKTPEARVAGLSLQESDLSEGQLADLQAQAREVKSLEELLPGSEVHILRALSETIAEVLMQDKDAIRPFSIVSADVAQRSKLRSEGVIAVDAVTKHTAFYRRAIERIDDSALHHEIDIFTDLPYPDEEFALITAFDGPFAETLPDDPRAQVEYLKKLTFSIRELYRILKPGGKLIIWPFGPLLNGRVDMDSIAGVLDGLGDIVPPLDDNLKIIRPEQLINWMTEMEREVAHNRGILSKSLVPADDIKSRGVQFGFIVDKPRRSKHKTNGKDVYINSGHEN